MGGLCDRQGATVNANVMRYVCSNDRRIFYDLCIHCEDHKLCAYCSYRSLEKKCCIVCFRSLTACELRSKSVLQSTCFNCGKASLNAVPISCKCYLCEECKLNSLANDKCLVCRSKISGKILKECIVCTTQLTREEMPTLDCEHYFCTSCLRYYIEMYMKDQLRDLRANKGIPCFNCPCPIGYYIVQSILSAEKFEIYCRCLIEANECPQCKIAYVTDEQIIQCSNCRYVFCDTCLKSAKSCSCKQSEQIEGLELSACPGCRSLYDKDSGCSHVKCMKPGCGTEFCFECSCLRNPTLAHGNHYHRPSCPYYSDYSGLEDVFDSNCYNCVKAGKLCQKPKNLKVQRRIGKDEV